MAIYNSTSKKAEEFINHEKILETLEYAEAHKDDLEMMNQILEKGRKYQGLSYKEAMTLLECEDPAIIQQIFALGKEIKEHFYGNRIVMFAPLYLSNYCINRCVYCPYHGQNKHIPRKKLSQEDIRQEVIALQDMGHKRLAIEAGEDPLNNPIEYILESIKTIYKSTRCSKTRGSERISFSRRLTTRNRTRRFIRQGRRATTRTTPRRWTEPWRQGSTTSAAACFSDWKTTNMTLSAC